MCISNPYGPNALRKNLVATALSGSFRFKLSVSPKSDDGILDADNMLSPVTV